MKTYTITTTPGMNPVAQIKAIRVLFSIGLKHAKDLRDASVNYGGVKCDYDWELDPEAYFAAKEAGVDVVEFKQPTIAPVKNEIVEINADMVALLKIMERAVRTDNQGLHRAVVALIDQIFMEK